MSGAMGDEHDPQTGEPIEPADAAVDEADQTAEPSDRTDAGASAAQGDSAVADAGASDGEPSTSPDSGRGDDDASDVAPEGAEPEAAAGASGIADADRAEAVKEPAADTATYELDDDVVMARAGEAAPGVAPETAPDDAAEASASGAADEAATDVISAAGDETATEAIDSARGDAATDVLPAADAVPEPDAGGEPDYAALAAELEEFEARQTTAAPTTGADREAPGSGWFEQAPETFRATEPGEPLPDDAPTEVVEPAAQTAATAAATAVLPSEPASTEEAPAAGEKQSAVIFETYEPPRKRGNRVAALLIGIPATIVFAILYTAVDLAWAWIQNEVALESIVPDLLGRIAEPAHWIPVATFFIAFWLVGVIVNRGRAGWWVILGFLVALATYAGFVCAPVVAYPFWLMTPNDAMGTIEELWLNPVAIGTFIIAREVTIWFGAWVAGRGRRMKRMNAEDKAEYDRAVASGE